MPLDDIFPITQTGDNAPPTSDVNIATGQELTGGKSMSPQSLWEAPTLDTLIQKVSTQRAMPQEQEQPFGKSLSLDRAALLDKEASGTPVQFQMMAGKYFAQLPLVTGKYSSELPVAAMLADEGENDTQSQRQLDALNKKLSQPKWFPAISQLGQDIFSHDVLDKYDEAYSLYGKRAARVLNGGGKTNSERKFARDFMEAVNADANLANLTTLVGNAATKIQNRGKGEYVDPEVDKFVSEYLGGMESMRGAPKEDFFAYINEGNSKLTKLLNFNDALKKTIRGVPGVDSLVEAQIGTAAQALANEGVPISGQEIIRKIGVDSQPAQLIENAAISLTKDGYTWGLAPDKAIEENKRRILSSYFDNASIPYYAQPYQKQTAGQKEAEKYDVAPVKSGISKMTNGEEEFVQTTTLAKVGGGALASNYYSDAQSREIFGRPTGNLANYEKTLGGGSFMEIAVPKKSLAHPTDWTYMTDEEKSKWMDDQWEKDPNNFETVQVSLSDKSGNRHKFETAFGRRVNDIFKGGKAPTKAKAQEKKEAPTNEFDEFKRNK